MPLAILLPIAFGVVIGVLLGLIGGGGSVLTIPILVYIIGEDVHQATITSLVIVGVTAIVGTISHARAGRVVTSTAVYVGLSGVGGTFVGAFLNKQVSGPLILFLFGFVMLATAAKMATPRRPVDDASEKNPSRSTIWTLTVGVVIGVMTGFFGVGGGFLIVPALVLLLGFSMPVAVGTSLAIIAINSLAALAAHSGSIDIDAFITGMFIIGGLAGSILGGTLVHRVNEALLTRGFALLVAILGIVLIAENGIAIA